MEITAALVKEKGEKFELEKIQLGEPREDEVLVRIVATGTCHTDMMARDGLLSNTFPVILGHEGAGIVEKVGSEVKNLQSGDHVVLIFGFCRECANCQGGKPTYCKNFPSLNLAGARLDGSHSHHNNHEAIFDNFFSQSSFATYAITNKKNVSSIEQSAVGIIRSIGMWHTNGSRIYH